MKLSNRSLILRTISHKVKFDGLIMQLEKILAFINKTDYRNNNANPYSTVCHKFLSDNCGEFSNEGYRNFYENFNIVPGTTAAESPWGNGTCERHNGVPTESVTIS